MTNIKTLYSEYNSLDCGTYKELQSEIHTLTSEFEKLNLQVLVKIWQVFGKKTVAQVRDDLSRHFDRIGDTLTYLEKAKQKANSIKLQSRCQEK